MNMSESWKFQKPSYRILFHCATPAIKLQNEAAQKKHRYVTRQFQWKQLLGSSEEKKKKKNVTTRDIMGKADEDSYHYHT